MKTPAFLAAVALLPILPLWAVTTVDQPGIVGQFTSLAFEHDVRPALSYFQQATGDLRFARKGLFKTAP